MTESESKEDKKHGFMDKILQTIGEDEENDPESLAARERTERFFQKLMPYQKPIMIWGLIILIMLVVFLGVAYGGMKVCSDLDGLLDDRFKCHPNFYPKYPKFDSTGQPFNVEDIVYKNGTLEQN